MSKPQFSRGKTLLFLAIIFAVFGTLLEIGASLAIRVFSETGSFADRKLQNRFHPFLGWENTPSAHLKTTKLKDGPETFIDTGADGNSVTPLAAPQPRLHIVITGGSTMFGVGSSGNATTVPSLLETKIFERLGVAVEVTNLGVRGYQSFQEMLRLREWLLDHPADLVLSISGRNDASLARQNPDLRYGLLPRFVYENAVPLVRDAEVQKTVILNPLGVLRQHSAFVDLSLRLVQRLTGGGGPNRYRAADDESMAGAIHLENVLYRARVTAEHYRLMALMARDHGAEYRLMLQPTAYSWNRYPAEIPLLTADADAEMVQEQAFYAALAGQFAGDAVFRDLTRVLDDQSGMLYVDNCHYTDLAADALAEAVFANIRPLIELRLTR